MSPAFEGFASADFPTLENIARCSGCSGQHVYILILVLPSGSEIPFYVGQTSRFWSRMWDYCTADFEAPTDFRVGEAVRYFRANGCHVKVMYKPTENPRKDERELIRELQLSGVRLMNGLVGYDYL